MLTDPDVLAINQDRAAVQAVRVGAAGTTETWVKRLADGSRAVVLLNRGDSAIDLTHHGGCRRPEWIAVHR
jgi:alpha-galactosidase